MLSSRRMLLHAPHRTRADVPLLRETAVTHAALSTAKDTKKIVIGAESEITAAGKAMMVTIQSELGAYPAVSAKVVVVAQTIEKKAAAAVATINSYFKLNKLWNYGGGSRDAEFTRRSSLRRERRSVVEKRATKAFV